MDKDDKTKAIDGIHDGIIDGLPGDDGFPGDDDIHGDATNDISGDATGLYLEEDEVAAHDTSDTIHAVIDNNVFINDDGSLSIVEPIDNTTVYGPPSWFGLEDPVDSVSIIEGDDGLFVDPVDPNAPEPPEIGDDDEIIEVITE